LEQIIDVESFGLPPPEEFTMEDMINKRREREECRFDCLGCIRISSTIYVCVICYWIIYSSCSFFIMKHYGYICKKS
jgi:hypothetical protein